MILHALQIVKTSNSQLTICNFSDWTQNAISQFATDTKSNYKDSSYSSSECQTIVNLNPKFTWGDKYYLCRHLMLMEMVQ